jgi:type IV pili sensor histidine kinase/response regulator
MKYLFMVLVVVLFSGCAHQQPVATTDEQEKVETANPVTEIPVRYGRYTLVNTSASSDQVDLLSQIVDARIPASMNPTIKESLDHVLLRTGFSLCPPPSPEVETLFSRPLPAAHYRIGPMSLRNALLLLAGPAYQIGVNEITRTVCFSAKPEYLMPLLPDVAAAEAVAGSVAVVKEDNE